VCAAQEVTRLGQDLLPDGTLKPGPMERSLAVLTRYAALAASHGAAAVRVVGTSALREARNGEEFVAAARRHGVALDVISGEEEARLTLHGIRADAPGLPGRITMLDIGGGSTELLAADGLQVHAVASLALGAVRLTEAHLRSDPPCAADLAACSAAIGSAFDGLHADTRDALCAPALVGTAGTITTLAAIDLGLAVYDPARVRGHVLQQSTVGKILDRLVGLPLARRRQLPGLEPARADIIVAGVATCLTAMLRLGFERLIVSDGGLREGVLLDELV
jgi:exopolyphosphatase/guanosine-5'-triphosphate,3'-diphosphate pyrophosphatase